MDEIKFQFATVEEGAEQDFSPNREEQFDGLRELARAAVMRESDRINAAYLILSEKEEVKNAIVQHHPDGPRYGFLLADDRKVWVDDVLQEQIYAIEKELR